MIPKGFTSSVSLFHASSLPPFPSSVKIFTLAEINLATEKFSSDKILGEGGFGRVYLGILEDGTEVAMKLLIREDDNGDREFIAEVEMLSRLHHRNLIKLLGICIEGHTRCLNWSMSLSTMEVLSLICMVIVFKPFRLMILIVIIRSSIKNLKNDIIYNIVCRKD